jgi:hypothetical protein
VSQAPFVEEGGDPLDVPVRIPAQLDHLYASARKKS